MLNTGANEVRGNLIAAEFVGLELLGDGNTVQGNQIGTDAAGTAAIPSGLGVNVEGGDDNLIGGTSAEEANVISGNAFGGLQIEAGDATDPEEEIGPGTGNEVKGNFVGTDATATIAIPNGVGFGLAGLAITISDHNTIGGSEPGAGNVIAANDGEGLFIVGTGAEENRVLGNWIGTTPAGAANLGNGKSGVRILDASRNRVGETGANGSQNTIAHNGEDGVSVVQSAGTATGNAILRNAIFENGSAAGDLAIDLAADGLTANDALDADAGANALQNTPMIASSTSSGGGKVTWTLASAATTSYRLEFFASDACDTSGNGEAQRFLGASTVVTDAAGQAGAGTPASVAAGEQVTMTATRLTAAGVGPGDLRALGVRHGELNGAGLRCAFQGGRVDRGGPAPTSRVESDHREEHHVKYVILIHSNPQPWGHPTGDFVAEHQALPQEQRDAINADFEALLNEMSERGELVGGEALGDPSTSRLYRWDAGRPLATDGPYSEAKEHLAGFFLVDVESRERAEELAAQFSGPGETIELRPAMGPGGDDQ